MEEYHSANVMNKFVLFFERQQNKMQPWKQIFEECGIGFSPNTVLNGLPGDKTPSSRSQVSSNKIHQLHNLNSDTFWR